MKELMKQLQELRDAKDAGEFVKKEKLAYTAFDFLEQCIKREKKEASYDIKKENVKASIKTAELKVKTIKKPSKEELKKEARERVEAKLKADLDEFKQLAYQLLEIDNSVTLDWIESLPELLLSDKRQERKKAKKAALDLIRITSLRNIMSWETIEALKRQVTLTKSHSILKTLYKGEVIAGFQTPTLKERFEEAEKRATNVVPNAYAEFETFEKEKLVYLNKKRWADTIAKVLNAIVSVFGVGLVGAIAVVTVLPTIGVPLLLPVALGVLALLTLVGGYTEGFVYFGYVQKFCRQLFVGFFEGIDNKILNREAYKKYKKRDRHALTAKEIDEIKARYPKERFLKKTLVVISFLVSVAAGIGYMGLLFTEIMELLTSTAFLAPALLTSIPALALVPWVLAAIVAPIYTIVMAGMLYKAIKDNYLIKIKNHIVDLYSFDKAPQGRGKATHIVLCVLKTLGLALVLGFSVVAIVATAGLWLENSVNFLTKSLGLIEKLANGIGLAIWSVYVLTMLWFCAEKSLETVNSVTQFKLENLKASAKEAFSSPKKFFSFMFDLVFMVIHIASNASVAALGSEKASSSSLLQISVPNSVGAAADAGSETFIDAGDALGINHHHHHSSYAKHNLSQFYTDKEKHGHDHHGHSHGSIVKTGGKVVNAAKGLFAAPIKVEPKPLHAFGMRARSVV